MNIGQRIKEQRKKKGLTQSQLSEEIGLTLDMIKSMETNRSNPSIDTVSKLADLFGCTTDYLLGKESEADIFKSLAKEFKIDLNDPNEVKALRESILEVMRKRDEIERNK